MAESMGDLSPMWPPSNLEALFDLIQGHDGPEPALRGWLCRNLFYVIRS